MAKLTKTQQRALDNVTAGRAPGCNADTLETLLGLGLIVYVPMTLTTDGHYRPTTATERALAVGTCVRECGAFLRHVRPEGRTIVCREPATVLTVAVCEDGREVPHIGRCAAHPDTSRYSSSDGKTWRIEFRLIGG